MGMFSKVNAKKGEDKLDTPKEGIDTRPENTENEEKAEKIVLTAEPAAENAPAKKSSSEQKPAVKPAKKAKAPVNPESEPEAKPMPATEEKPAEQSNASNADKATYTGKFEIKKTKDNRFFFNLQASNRVYIATSQIYSSVQSAMTGIKSVIANAATARVEDQTLKSYEPVGFPKWEIYLDKAEQFRFRLCATNGNCVCHSQGYTTKHNCKKGIESIIKSVKNAEIEKTYLNKSEE